MKISNFLKQFAVLVFTGGMSVVAALFFEGMAVHGVAWPFDVAACLLSWAWGCMCGEFLQKHFSEGIREWLKKAVSPSQWIN